MGFIRLGDLFVKPIPVFMSCLIVQILICMRHCFSLAWVGKTIHKIELNTVNI